ncbi:putative n2n2-dimethylguanosine trna methyl transferase [Erysiphe necator]|uniref:Protein-lysine N-methyltransferase EFM6 n=1 Tax=Uncinula necator TaxID=52586 RepID=A0A0B1P713_UNCNE|nr:putative n2n2-dimethylguanosine trna methyl transferase [Erysiphe necator]
MQRLGVCVIIIILIANKNQPKMQSSSNDDVIDYSLFVREDLTPIPSYKTASTISHHFTNLLTTPIQLHEDLKSGCGGQLWPAGMVLAKHMLRYHKNSLTEARILELGAGVGLVGLSVAMGCQINKPIYITDQENMMDLMRKNIKINGLESMAQELVLEWGNPLPDEVLKRQPNLILAADCVYFEPSFPLLLTTLKDLSNLSSDTIIYFCFKKRRKADIRFLKAARKIFIVEEPEDEDRVQFSRQGLYLFTFKLKHWNILTRG